jgi:chromosome segregation ATPase
MGELIKIQEAEVQILNQDEMLKAFSDFENFKPIMAQLSEHVSTFAHDMSTGESRKKTASLAYKIARLKTALDDMGKGLTEDWKQKAKAVDIVRRQLRESLDGLKEQARQPLNEWEKEEEARKAAMETVIQFLDSAAAFVAGYRIPLETLEEKLAKVNETELTEEQFGSILPQVEAKKEKAINDLNNLITQEKEQIAKDEELARLLEADVKRAEEETKKREAEEQKKRDERIAEEATDQERKRLEKAEADKKAEDDRRALDKKHRSDVHTQIATALQNAVTGVGMKLAEEIVEEISEGKIKGLTIQY